MTTMRYTEDHEWIRTEPDGTATIGITTYAQDTLGDIVFVELPEVGKSMAQGEVACVVESVKAAADVKMPVTGTVTAVNTTLATDPGLVNRDAMTEGWFMKIKPADSAAIDALMDQKTYFALTGQ